eukprot:CAMPEP_0182578698 /NCGR_PEP_ID=MMETSP1324-20130603/41848_1 /TAXON_ID=236786 /ORGANISM="Florenciella sp., Strain RCC1587" /LENGTH=70 /DNA_ID=CAMNT_0024794679 /DNA_START=74 /DNA_END=282 /DNA_ORIENTATION=+
MSPSSGKSVTLSDSSQTACPWHARRLPEIHHRRLSVRMSPDSATVRGAVRAVRVSWHRVLTPQRWHQVLA